MLNFIYNARKTGVSDDDIKTKLSASGWKGEQISYAFKKIDGKRVRVCTSCLKTIAKQKTK